MSETVLILTAAVAVLLLLFGVRLAVRMSRGGGATTSADVAGVIALPPFIFLGFLAAAAVLETIVPLTVATANPALRYIVGAALAGLGVLIGVAATRRFRTAGTNVSTSQPTTALVVDGVYARTRNPFYVASMLLYGGVAVAAGSLWTIALLIPLLWVINIGVIAPEERYLERKFGDSYRAYRARVRRWL